jgi:hypothetical protein
MTLLSHSMTFIILSPRKFADVAGNLMLMTLPLRLALCKKRENPLELSVGI